MDWKTCLSILTSDSTPHDPRLRWSMCCLKFIQIEKDGLENLSVKLTSFRAEIGRLAAWTGPGVTITRADAIRSLFARAQVLDSIAELEAELESRKEGVLLAEITSRKAKEMQEVA